MPVERRTDWMEPIYGDLDKVGSMEGTVYCKLRAILYRMIERKQITLWSRL
jgi:hypothetical protein